MNPTRATRVTQAILEELGRAGVPWPMDRDWMRAHEDLAWGVLVVLGWFASDRAPLPQAHWPAAIVALRDRLEIRLLEIESEAGAEDAGDARSGAADA